MSNAISSNKDDLRCERVLKQGGRGWIDGESSERVDQAQRLRGWMNKAVTPPQQMEYSVCIGEGGYQGILRQHQQPLLLSLSFGWCVRECPISSFPRFHECQPRVMALSPVCQLVITSLFCVCEYNHFEKIRHEGNFDIFLPFSFLFWHPFESGGEVHYP